MRPACKWAALCLRSSANLRDQVQRACTGHQDHRTGLRSADGCIQSLLCENAHTHTHFRRCALDWIYRHRTEKHTFWGNGSGKKGLGALGETTNYFRYLIAFCQKQFALDEPPNAPEKRETRTYGNWNWNCTATKAKWRAGWQNWQTNCRIVIEIVGRLVFFCPTEFFVVWLYRKPGVFSVSTWSPLFHDAWGMHARG